MKPSTLADTLARAKLICIGASPSACAVAWLLSGCAVSSPVTSSGPVPVFAPSPIAGPKIPTFKALVSMFGAIPDDGKDDTRAVQAGLDAVNAAGGGTLEFAPGRYDLSINPLKRRALTLYSRLRLAGSSVAGSSVAGSSVAGKSGAILYLADNQIIYESIMATATYPTRLEDVEFINLTFDANGLNNPVKSPDETNGDLGAATLRYVIRSFAGERVRIRNCTFINLENGNTVSFNGEAVSDIAIEDSKFLAVGGASIDHDHSTIYTDGRRFKIANNEFQARDGAGTKGARTAIETHGDDIEVRGNTITGYMQGANIVGRATTPSRQLFSGNAIKAVAVGLKIWPLGDAGPSDPKFSDSRPAFTSLGLVNNDIGVDADAWWASGAMVTDAPAGIAFEAGVSDGRVARLDMVNNRIRFNTFAGKTANEDRISVGIGLRGIEGKLQLERVNVSQNTVRNAIGPCILSTANLGGSEASRVESNTLTDCGRGLNLRGAGDVLRTGVVIGGTTRNLTLSQNVIASSTVPASTLSGFLLASSCSSACVVTANKTSGIQQAVLIPGTGWTNSGP